MSNKPKFDPRKPFDVVDERPKFNPDKPFEVLDEGSTAGDFVTGLEAGALLGARPFVAGVGGGAGAAFETLVRTGEASKALSAGKEAFSQAKREAQEQERLASKRSPLASLGGQVAGSIATLPLVAAKGIAGAAKTGAAFGTAEALGHAESLDEAAQKIGKGIAFGVAGEGVARGVARGAGALKNVLAKKLQSEAQKSAIRASGTMLKDVRRLHGKGSAEKIAQTGLDEGIISFKDDFSSIANKSQLARKNTGEAISDIYQKVDDIVTDPAEIAKFTPGQAKKLAETDLDMERLAADLFDDLTEELSKQPGGRS